MAGPDNPVSGARTHQFLTRYLEAPIVRALVRVGVPPNAITLLGLMIAGASAYLLAIGELAAGGLVLLISGLFDLFDGAVARAAGRSTRYGALLDSVADRVGEAAVLLGLLIFYLDESSSFNSIFTSTLGVVLVYLTLAGSMMVSYVRARAAGLGIDYKGGVMTRPERVVSLGAGLIVGGLWWLPAVSVLLATMAALTVFTSVQRVIYARRALQREEPAFSTEVDPET